MCVGVGGGGGGGWHRLAANWQNSTQVNSIMPTGNIARASNVKIAYLLLYNFRQSTTFSVPATIPTFSQCCGRNQVAQL